MKLPCKDCLIIPICRNKTFRTLITQCTLVRDFVWIASHDHIPSYKYEVMIVIKPKLWRSTKSGILYFTDEFIDKISSNEVKLHLIGSRRKALEGR